MTEIGFGGSHVKGLPRVNVPFPSAFSVPQWAVEDQSKKYADIIEEDFWIYEKDPITRVVYRAWPFNSAYPYLVFGRDMARCHCFVGHGTVSPEHCAFVWDRDGICCLLNLEPSEPLKVVVPGEHPVTLSANESRKLNLQDLVMIGDVPRVYALHMGGKGAKGELDASGRPLAR